MSAMHLDLSNPVPGIYRGLPMASYLAINALSATPLRKSVDECPRAGWFASRLNPNRPARVTSDEMDVGTLAHEALLEGSMSRLVTINPADYPADNGNVPSGWTNPKIRKARDAARAEGKCPVFPEAWQAISLMEAEARMYIAELRKDEPAIHAMMQPDGGASEVVMVWDDGGVLCKIRHDRLAADNRISLDLKTTGRSVEPDRFGRTTLPDHAFDAAFYRRGVRALCGVDCESVYLCQEVREPYLCSLIGLDMAWKQVGDAKVAAALNGWRECLRTGRWPGYPARAVYPEMPAWEVARWEAQSEAGVDEARGIPYEYAALTGREGPK